MPRPLVDSVRSLVVFLIAVVAIPSLCAEMRLAASAGAAARRHPRSYYPSTARIINARNSHYPGMTRGRQELRLVNSPKSSRWWSSSSSTTTFIPSSSRLLWRGGSRSRLKYGSSAPFTTYRRTPMTMMPEGPEVRTLVDQLQGGVGQKIQQVQLVSGRYQQFQKPPEGYTEFHTSLSPNNPNCDVITSWYCKGKFMYMLLDEGQQSHPDNLRSIWITLGMTGKFLNEAAHRTQQQQSQAMTTTKINPLRWILQVQNTTTNHTTNIYYYDVRNFGTLKFVFSRQLLLDKLQSLGMDVLNDETFTEFEFKHLIQSQRPTLNICQFLMDQSKLCGIGNYLLSEILYRAQIDPFATMDELEVYHHLALYQEIYRTTRESYQAQGVTREKYGQYQSVDGTQGQYQFELQCYGREICAKGHPVHKEVNGPHGRTIWYTEQQLFRPRSERAKLALARVATTRSSSSSTTTTTTTTTTSRESDAAPPMSQALATTPRRSRAIGSSRSTNSTVTSSTGDNVLTMSRDPSQAVTTLLEGLHEPSWKHALAPAFASESFRQLALFLEQEERSGCVVYPPKSQIFTALNVCPLNQVKVIVVGQDPYHGPGQAQGLAFSVPKGVKPPPSLQNILREVYDNVGMFDDPPRHGCLMHWAQQGVLLLNTVLTVRQGQANSHAKQGWEEFTDAVIQAVLHQQPPKSIVLMLWGNPAQKKAGVGDLKQHVVIASSHPSPLGATKTASPFLGSKCFTRANAALLRLGHDPIDWSLP